jgi:hypothetical protein
VKRRRTSGSTNGGEFLHQLSYDQLLNNDSAPWSQIITDETGDSNTKLHAEFMSVTPEQN